MGLLSGVWFVWESGSHAMLLHPRACLSLAKGGVLWLLSSNSWLCGWLAALCPPRGCGRSHPLRLCGQQLPWSCGRIPRLREQLCGQHGGTAAVQPGGCLIAALTAFSSLGGPVLSPTLFSGPGLTGMLAAPPSSPGHRPLGPFVPSCWEVVASGTVLLHVPGEV